MRSRWIGPIVLGIFVVVAGAGRNNSQERSRGQIATVPADKELSWPLSATVKTYAAIDGLRMKKDVDELVAISRKSRDAGNQQWGRIAGTPSGEETQQWLSSKFRQAGLEVRIDEFGLPPQTFPKSWEVNVSGAGKTLRLTSASPIITFPNYMPSAEGDLNLETVWAGLGMARFHRQRRTRQGCILYSVPTPSSLIQSAKWMGARSRAAQEKGAAALFVALRFRNLSFVSHAGTFEQCEAAGIHCWIDDGEAVNPSAMALPTCGSQNSCAMEGGNVVRPEGGQRRWRTSGTDGREHRDDLPHGRLLRRR
jgi:hypothetical protein